MTVPIDESGRRNQLREADGLLAAGSSIRQICQRLEISESVFHIRNQLS